VKLTYEVRTKITTRFQIKSWKTVALKWMQLLPLDFFNQGPQAGENTESLMITDIMGGQPGGEVNQPYRADLQELAMAKRRDSWSLQLALKIFHWVGNIMTHIPLESSWL
jgi:hypothetical protein